MAGAIGAETVQIEPMVDIAHRTLRRRTAGLHERWMPSAVSRSRAADADTRKPMTKLADDYPRRARAAPVARNSR